MPYNVGDQVLAQHEDALGLKTWYAGEVKEVDGPNQMYHVQLKVGGIIVWFADKELQPLPTPQQQPANE